MKEATVSPAVDVIIATHNARRPVERAARSVLDGWDPANGVVRVSVVCHNTDSGPIRERFGDELPPQVRFLELRDDIPSPAGPFNYGLSQATAPYVSIMGSDDWLEPGALRAWWEMAEARRSSAVIPRQIHADGRIVRTPPIRLWRRGALNAVKDRLGYRTAPLGLLRRSVVEDLGLAFSVGRRSGEDQEFSTRLWFQGGRIDFAGRYGSYVVGDDATDRVTKDFRPLSEDFAFVDGILRSEWFPRLSAVEQRSVAARIVRVQFFASVQARVEGALWDDEARDAAAATAEQLISAVPAAMDIMSREDATAFSLIRHRAEDSDLRIALSRRRRFGTPGTLFTSNPAKLLAPDAPLRFMAASLLLR